MRKPIDAERSRRGLGAFQEQIASVKTEGVSEAVVTMGKGLLSQAADMSKSTIFTDETIVDALAALVQDTPFSGASIVARDKQPKPGSWYKGMSALLGQYPLGDKENGAFNVWFTRENEDWVLNYNPVPAGGNMR